MRNKISDVEGLHRLLKFNILGLTFNKRKILVSCYFSCLGCECLGLGRTPATGGNGGKIYTVTNLADDDLVNPRPGTLHHTVILPGKLWIIFGHSMVIRSKGLKYPYIDGKLVKKLTEDQSFHVIIIKNLY